jgi:hypothetical protein
MSKTNNESPKKISLSEHEQHELRMMLIMGGPEPISVRKVKAMTDRALRLQQEIITFNDPETCRRLLPWVSSSLDDLIESANRQASASRKLDAALEAFARKKAAMGR